MTRTGTGGGGSVGWGGGGEMGVSFVFEADVGTLVVMVMSVGLLFAVRSGIDVASLGIGMGEIN